MTGQSAQELREAASLAHRRGDTEAAASLFWEIAKRHPGTPEAVDAALYLSSIDERREPKGIGAAVAKNVVAKK